MFPTLEIQEESDNEYPLLQVRQTLGIAHSLHSSGHSGSHSLVLVFLK